MDAVILGEVSIDRNVTSVINGYNFNFIFEFWAFIKCLENIARFKRPKDYYAIDELPKNNYGKVLKTELRKRLEKMG